MNELAVLLSMYLGIVPLYARRQRRAASRRREVAEHGGPLISVDVIVTCYNEQPTLLSECLRSLHQQDYGGRIRVWVVDDGSQNRAELLPVLAKYGRPGWMFLLSNENYGKRTAQALALQEGQGEVVITVDSDTMLASDGVRQIVAPFSKGLVGAVTGRIGVRKTDDSWLAETIESRYELLCMRERAAQGSFGSVLCCAGPFSAFRRTALEGVLPRYLAPRRFTRQKRSGDDLELTNLVLGEWYRSEYQPNARAWTHVPATIPEFARQQRRWNSSFYRELPRMLRTVARNGSYMVHDLVARALVPPLLAAGLVVTAADALRAPEHLVFDAGALALMALASLQLLPSLASKSGRRFVIRYGLIFVGLLLPVRFWALITVLWDRWGTRKLPPGPSRSLASRRAALLAPTSLPFFP